MILSRFKKYFVPEKAETRAHTLRHEALFVYALVLFVMQFSIHSIATRFPGVFGFASNITTQDVFDQSNRRRIENGLSPLNLNGELSAAAAQKAQDMFNQGYWAHIGPNGATPWSFILKSGYDYVYAGENLAKDFQNSEDVVNAWYASPSHRDNLLSSHYQDMGVAIVNGVLSGFETTLVVQMFGSRTASPFLAQAKQEPAPSAPALTSAPAPAPAVTVTPVPSGKALTGPTLASPEFASGSTIVVASPVYLASTEKNPLIPVIDIIKVTKSISFAFGFFLLSLFIVDGIIVVRHRHLRLSGHNLAHLGILLLLMGATWYTSVGSVI